MFPRFKYTVVFFLLMTMVGPRIRVQDAAPTPGLKGTIGLTTSTALRFLNHQPIRSPLHSFLPVGDPRHIC